MKPHRMLEIVTLGALCALAGCQSRSSDENATSSPARASQELRTETSGPATTQRPAGPPWQEAWQITARPNGGYLIGGDVDGQDGSIDVAIAGIELDARGGGWRNAQLGFGLDYEYRNYDFDFGGPEPFFGTDGDQSVDFHSLGLNASVLQAFNRNWGAFLRASVQGSAEIDADIMDGISWNVIAGVGYRVTDDLLIGLGVGVLGRLEEDLLVIPALQLRWTSDEEWTLSLEGPGLALSWKPRDDWKLTLGARFDSRRYRLEDETPTNAGIFEDRRIPITLQVEHALSERWSVDATVGVDAYRRFEVEDRDGRNDVGFDADPGVFLGLGLTATF
ncbi:MAG: hypothetical protein KDB53_15675 [Planctomycetes bacterium]|nr:hypothetical protein [Planctomycetota bacterium]